MIDVPLEAAGASPEQVIEQKLVECGINRGGLSIAYSDLLQSVEIIIGPTAGAKTEHFACVHDAAGTEIVTFENSELYRAYADFCSDLARPKILAMARKSLADKGLLEGFPDRNDFASDDEFAEAIEVHCGFKPKSTIQRTALGLVVLPKAVPSVPLTGPQWDRFSCLIGALMYASALYSDLKIGFIGNEQVQEPKAQ